LKRYSVESFAVEKLRRPDIIIELVVLNLEAHCRGIVIGMARVRHGNDAGLEIRPSHRDRLMKIMGKCRYAAATRKMIADERYTLN
jgi:hypothetical protein